MRLTRWEVSGYKSISSARVSIDERTLLAGKNDSGKSNLLESLLDYQGIFGTIPTTARIRGNFSFDEWWEICSSRYTERDEIQFSATFVSKGEDEYGELVSDASTETSTRPEWSENRLEEGDFRKHRHEITLSSDGLETEILYSNIGDTVVPVFVRLNSGATVGKLIFSKIDAPLEDAEYSEVSDLTDVLSSDDFEDVLLNPSSPPAEGDWYWEQNEDEVLPAVGGIIDDWLHHPIQNAINSWSKVDAFREPFLSRSSSHQNESGSSESRDDVSQSTERQGRYLSSDMVNLDEYLADIYTDDTSEESIDEIQEKYKETIEGIGNIDIRPVIDGDSDFEITIERGGEEFNSERLSAGAKQAISLVTKLHKSGIESNLLIIEEPEVHLHSSAIRRVWDYVETLVDEEDLHLIISTHSPTVVDVSNSDDLKLFRRSEQTLTKSVDYGDVKSDLANFNCTPGVITQSQAIVIVEGSLSALLLQMACRELGPDPVSSGLRIIPLGEKVEDNLDDIDSVVDLSTGLGIQTRLITLEEEDEEEPEFIARWPDRFDCDSGIVDHYQRLPISAHGWLDTRWSDIETQLNNELDHSFSLGEFDMAEPVECIGTTDLLMYLQSEADVYISERDLIRAISNVEMDSDTWDSITVEVSGLLR